MLRIPGPGMKITPERRKKFMIFLLCLLFSFTAWLFSKMTRDVSAVYPFGFYVENIPDDLIITHQSDSLLALNVVSTGLRLLSSGLSRSYNEFTTDFSNLQRMGQPGDNEYFFSASQAETQLSLKTEFPRSAIEVSPDTIFFTTQKAFRKKVPVVLHTQIEYQPGFKKYDLPGLSPDSVYVTGPAHLFDSVRDVHTEVLEAKGVDGDLNRKLKLITPFPGNQISLSHAETHVAIAVEEFTESKVSLPLHHKCHQEEALENGFELLLFPDHVDVYYLVALKDDKAVLPEMFKVEVSCPDTTQRRMPRIKPTVSEHPGIVEILRIKPSEVEYVWIKK